MLLVRAPTSAGGAEEAFFVFSFGVLGGVYSVGGKNSLSPYGFDGLRWERGRLFAVCLWGAIQGTGYKIELRQTTLRS